MLILVDAGNTRTKWAKVQKDGALSAMQAVSNASIRTSAAFKKVIAQATKVVVANVAGGAVEQALIDMVPDETELVCVAPQSALCNVTNRYEKKEALGADRWAAVIAAWEMNKQPTLVINAGTAITIDALSRDNTTRKGIYLGGMILPGLVLMHQSLDKGTKKLSASLDASVVRFPKNTEEAIATGCMRAVVGAIVLQLKQLEKNCAFLPKVVISGGDAVKIAEALKSQVKRIVVADDLVLQGLQLIEKENV